MQAPFLFIISSDGVFFFQLAGVTTVGRGSFMHRPDLVLNRKYISTIQGKFRMFDGEWIYWNTSGINTYVNGSFLDTGNAVSLRDRDTICYHPGNISDDFDVICLVFCTAEEDISVPWERVKSFHPQNVCGTPAIQDGQLVVRLARSAFVQHKSGADRGTAYNAGSEHGREIYKRIGSDPEVKTYQEAGSRGEANVGLTISIHERRGDHDKLLLKDISLELHDGEMVLVLGGSGAGKTTFMNAVTGFEKADAYISYCGTDFYRDEKVRTTMIKRVPQFDTLRDNDSVFLTLDDIAQIFLPVSVRYNPSVRRRRVMETLDLFGLSAEAKSKVSKLSGGQRKRLSIAAEYIKNPKIFFLDEPDSGLDSASALELMKNLRSVADLGRIIMLISHSPDRCAEYFDKVIVLAKDSCMNCGRLAFFGTREQAKVFFETPSLERIVQLVNRKEEGGEGLADYYINKFSISQTGQYSNYR